MKVVKHILPILLIVAICAPFHISELIISQQKKLVKRNVKEMMVRNMDKSELTRLEFDMHTVLHKLKWEHSSEFEYNGVMYDVMYRNYENDKVVYHCWKDKVETALNSRLEELTLIAFGNDEKREQQTDLLCSFIGSLYCQANDVFIPYAALIFNDCTSVYRYNYTEFDIQIPSPPPCV